MAELHHVISVNRRETSELSIRTSNSRGHKSRKKHLSSGIRPTEQTSWLSSRPYQLQLDAWARQIKSEPEGMHAVHNPRHGLHDPETLLVSLFPRARNVAVNQKNAWANSLSSQSTRRSELPPLRRSSTGTEGARPECGRPPENPRRAKGSP